MFNYRYKLLIISFLAKLEKEGLFGKRVREGGTGGNNDNSVADVKEVAIVILEVFSICEGDVVADVGVSVDNGVFYMAIVADGKFRRKEGSFRGMVIFVADDDGVADDGIFAYLRS